MTSVITYSRTRSVTYVTDNILKRGSEGIFSSAIPASGI